MFLKMLLAEMLLLFSLVSAYQSGTPHSTVQTLTETNFRQALQDPANGLWFLKFYAPWCGHCKRLAPVLDEVAPLVKGKMAIGKIDCTVEKKLCDEFDIRGYPTLKFSRDGDIKDFPGSRVKEDLLMFARKMSEPPISSCPSHADAQAAAADADNGIVFAAYHPNMKGDSLKEQLQSTHLTQIFNQVARVHQAVATFCVMDPALASKNHPQLAATRFKNGFVARYETGVPEKVFEGTTTSTSADLSAWVKHRNVPLVSKFGPQNFGTHGRLGKPLVIGAISEPSQEEEMKKKLLEVALLNENYYFGYMDGKQWQKFLSQFQVDTFPQVFVLDVPKKMYWQDESLQNNLKAFLRAIEDGTIEPQQAGSHVGGGVMGQFQHAFLRYMPWSLFGLLGMVILIVLLCLPNPGDLRPPYPQEHKAPTNEATTQADESKKTK